MATMVFVTFLIAKDSSDQFFKLEILNKKATFNKTRDVLIENELNELSKKV